MGNFYTQKTLKHQSWNFLIYNRILAVLLNDICKFRYEKDNLYPGFN
jgi:hypothetical protein